MAKLGELYKITSGGTPSRTHSEYYEDGTIPWVKTGDLKDKYLFETDEKISQLGLENSSARIYLKNTVLLAMYGATIGATSILKIDAATNQACAAFSPREDTLPEYLYAFLESQKDKFIKDAVGGAQPNLSAGYLKTIEFKLPSLEQQTRITRNLSKIDELLLLRKQQLAKLDELVKARFVEMFGDAKLNPNNLPCCSLSEYIVFLTSGSRGWSQYFTDSGEYFITIKNVKNCKITLQDVQCVTPPDNAEAKRTRVQENDLLISITADLGRTGIVTKEIAEHGAYINQHLTCIRLKQDKLNPLYVAYYMESDAGKEQFIAKNQSAVKAGLNFNAINSLKLMVPPLSLQNEFAAFVERVDQQKQTVQQSLEKLELMKKALMQEYFG